MHHLAGPATWNPLTCPSHARDRLTTRPTALTRKNSHSLSLAARSTPEAGHQKKRQSLLRRDLQTRKRPLQRVARLLRLPQLPVRQEKTTRPSLSSKRRTSSLTLTSAVRRFTNRSAVFKSSTWLPASPILPHQSIYPPHPRPHHTSRSPPPFRRQRTMRMPKSSCRSFRCPVNVTAPSPISPHGRPQASSVVTSSHASASPLLEMATHLEFIREQADRFTAFLPASVGGNREG